MNGDGHIDLCLGASQYWATPRPPGNARVHLGGTLLPSDPPELTVYGSNLDGDLFGEFIAGWLW